MTKHDQVFPCPDLHQDDYIRTSNPLCVWKAINDCLKASPPRPLADWVNEYLLEVSQELLDFYPSDRKDVRDKIKKILGFKTARFFAQFKKDEEELEIYQRVCDKLEENSKVEPAFMEVAYDMNMSAEKVKKIYYDLKPSMNYLEEGAREAEAEFRKRGLVE